MSEKENELYRDRLKKLEELKKIGIDPYPASAKRTHLVSEALADFDDLIKKETSITLAGRIKAMRGHGKLIFGNLEDESGHIQFAIKADVADPQSMRVFGLLDLGDFVQIMGTCFTTQKGERTLLVRTAAILTKSLRALPEKYHGLKDFETRLRKRYLDLATNRETRQLFRSKSLFWQAMREFLLAEGFLEVQLPVLEQIPGGAEAEPFITHHNALDQDFYLRISLELPLKRLLVGGYEKVFEIGPIFRNEGIDAEHLQDYYQLEFYWAYADYEQLKDFLQRLYRSVIERAFGTLKIASGGHIVDWSMPWKTYDYYELFREHAGLDLSKCSDTDLKSKADSLGIQFEPAARRGRLIDLIYKKTVRPKLVEPGFLVDPPVEIEPLAKRLPSDPRRVQRLQMMAYGTELGKGFSELNDPIDQRGRFEEQMKLREAGDKEAQMLDEDFVEALEYGMPPAAGFGVSERLFSKLVDKPMRETVFFPPMRREDVVPTPAKKETRVAVAIINSGAGLERWQELNTIAHLSAAFGAREGRGLFMQDTVRTQDEHEIFLNIRHAIMIRTAPGSAVLINLADSARQAGLHVAEFTREMLDTTNDKKVAAAVAEKSRKDVEYLGLLVFGEKSEVDRLTADRPLYQ